MFPASLPGSETPPGCCAPWTRDLQFWAQPRSLPIPDLFCCPHPLSLLGGKKSWWPAKVQRSSIPGLGWKRGEQAAACPALPWALGWGEGGTSAHNLYGQDGELFANNGARPTAPAVGPGGNARAWEAMEKRAGAFQNRATCSTREGLLAFLPAPIFTAPTLLLWKTHVLTKSRQDPQIPAPDPLSFEAELNLPILHQEGKCLFRSTAVGKVTQCLQKKTKPKKNVGHDNITTKNTRIYCFWKGCGGASG